MREAGISSDDVARHVRIGVLEARGPVLLAVHGTPPSWEQRIWAALLTARRRSVASHRTAASLHDAGRFGRGHIDVVEVDHLSHRAIDAAAHRSSSVPDHHTTIVRGIPVTTLPRTIFDLASQVSVKRYRRGLPSLRPAQVERALDDALGRGLPISEVEALLAQHGGRGRGGTKVLRAILADRGEGFVATESELEDLLADVLHRHGLPRPARQRNVGGLDDRIGRVDFLFTDCALVIEVDGRRNHTALLDREADAWRDLELAAAGFVVLRVTWSQLTQSPGRFVRNLRSVLQARAQVAS